MSKFERGLRHLHFDGQPRSWSTQDFWTLCGIRRFVPFRSGSRVLFVRLVDSVHVTKARKTDCAECREAFRAISRNRRANALLKV